MAWPKRHFPEIKMLSLVTSGPGMIILPVTPLIVWNYIPSPTPEKRKRFNITIMWADEQKDCKGSQKVPSLEDSLLAQGGSPVCLLLVVSFMYVQTFIDVFFKVMTNHFLDQEGQERMIISAGRRTIWNAAEVRDQPDSCHSKSFFSKEIRRSHSAQATWESLLLISGRRTFELHKTTFFLTLFVPAGGDWIATMNRMAMVSANKKMDNHNNNNTNPFDLCLYLSSSPLLQAHI